MSALPRTEHVRTWIFQVADHTFKRGVLNKALCTRRQFDMKFPDGHTKRRTFLVVTRSDGLQLYYPADDLTMETCTVLYEEDWLWTTLGGFIPVGAIVMHEVHRG